MPATITSSSKQRWNNKSNRSNRSNKTSKLRINQNHKILNKMRSKNLLTKMNRAKIRDRISQTRIRKINNLKALKIHKAILNLILKAK